MIVLTVGGECGGFISGHVLIFHRVDASGNPGNNLHVSGLDPKVDNRELEALFSKYGKVGFCLCIT